MLWIIIFLALFVLMTITTWQMLVSAEQLKILKIFDILLERANRGLYSFDRYVTLWNRYKEKYVGNHSDYSYVKSFRMEMEREL